MNKLLRDSWIFRESFDLQNGQRVWSDLEQFLMILPNISIFWEAQNFPDATNHNDSACKSSLKFLQEYSTVTAKVNGAEWSFVSIGWTTNIGRRRREHRDHRESLCHQTARTLEASMNYLYPDKYRLRFKLLYRVLNINAVRIAEDLCSNLTSLYVGKGGLDGKRGSDEGIVTAARKRAQPSGWVEHLTSTTFKFQIGRNTTYTWHLYQVVRKRKRDRCRKD